MKHINQLNITRFAAAMTVVIFHYGRKAFPFQIYPIDALAATGNVRYFFVLSGFIMMLAYFKPEKKFNLKRFWFYRFARIYPIYLFSLIFTIALHPKFLRSLTGTVLNTTLLQAWVSPYPNSFNYPSWSLSVEIFFYLIFPLLIIIAYRIPFKILVALISIFWISDQILHAYLLNTIYTGSPSFTHDLLFYNPLVHLNSFLIGTIGGIWFTKNYNKQIHQGKNIILLLTSMLLLSFTLLYLKDIPHLLGLNFRVSIRAGILAPFYLLFLVTLSFDKTILSKILSHRFFVLLGDISYSVFILQYPVHTLYKKTIEPHFLNHSNTEHFYAYLFFLIIISYFTFKYIEKPARDKLREVYNNRGIKQGASAPDAPPVA